MNRNLEAAGERPKSIISALKKYYEKNDKLSIPFREEDNSNNSSPFFIKDSFRNLALLRSRIGDDDVNTDRFESSLAREQSSVYGNMCPLSLDLLFVPISSPDKIKRVLISGAAGIGKSTLCHHLAYQWSQGKMFNGPEGPLFDAVFWLALKELPNLSKNIVKLEEWIYYSCFDDDVRANYSITVEDIRQFIFVTHKERCLLILDGFDEVSVLFTVVGNPRQKLLNSALTYPQVVITTRPFGRVTLRQLGFNREVEDIGFSDESIQSFIDGYFEHEKRPGQAALLWEFIQRQSVLKRIASIPLQTYFLCFTWLNTLSKETGEGKVRLTDLYQKFIREIWVRRLSATDQEKLHSFLELECALDHHAVLNCFGQLAYEKLTADDAQYLFEKTWFNDIFLSQHKGVTIQTIMRIGIIRDDKKGNYLFVHPTLQEFFSAYFLYQQLTNNEKRQAKALRFILHNKYHSRYEIVMTFLIGLIYRKPIENVVKKAVWDALFVFDVDLIGIRHAQLIMLALEESGRLDNLEDINSEDQLLVCQLCDWVQASVECPDIEFAHMLRSQLLRQFVLCPEVTQRTFDQLDRSLMKEPLNIWRSLSNSNERKIMLTDYWLPLLGSLSEKYSQFVIKLVTENQQDESIDFVRSIDWTALKKTPLRKDLLQTLSQTIGTSWDTKYPYPEALIERMLPVWLSLLQVGDDQSQLLSVIEEHPESLLRWTAWLARVILNPLEKEKFLESLIFILKDRMPTMRDLWLIILALSDWNHPRNLLVEFWLLILLEPASRLSETQSRLVSRECRLIRQHALYRLEQLVDNASESDGQYQQVQKFVWHQRQWPLVEKVPYRRERLTILMNALHHKDERIVMTALHTLERCDNDQWNSEEGSELIEILLNKFYTIQDTVVRVAVLKALGSLARVCGERILPILLGEIFEDNVPELRIAAIEIFGKLNLLDEFESKRIFRLIFIWADGSECQHAQDIGQAIIYMLQPLIEDLDSRVRKAVVQAMGQFGRKHPRDSMPIILMALKDEKFELREAAVEALGQLDRPFDISPGLFHAVEDTLDKDIRKKISSFVLQNEFYVDGIFRELVLKYNDNVTLLNNAIVGKVYGIQSDHFETVISLLLSMIEDSQWRVRKAVAVALAQYSQHFFLRVIPGLLQLIKDNDVAVQQAAAITLSECPADVVIPKLLDIFKDQNPYVRIVVALALGRFDQNHLSLALSVLLLEIENKDSGRRKASAEVLGQLHQHSAEKVLPVLLKATADEEQEVRIAAVRALGHMGRTRVMDILPALIQLIRDKDLEVQKTSLSILIELAENNYEIIQPLLIKIFKEHFENLNHHLYSISCRIDACSFSRFSALIKESEQFDFYTATLYLPLICSYRMKILDPILNADATPLRLADFANAIKLLSDVSLREGFTRQLQQYYVHHQAIFMEQLFECLLQNLNSSYEIALLCKILRISSSTYLSQFDLWLKGKKLSNDWHAPIVCLAKLLCQEGASLSFSQNYGVVCQQTEARPFDIAQYPSFRAVLLEEIYMTLQEYKLPSRYVEDVIWRNLPCLLPRSKLGFFSKQSQTPLNYQPVYTYQKARATKSSVDCQEFCGTFFSDLRMVSIQQNEEYTLLVDPHSLACKVNLPKDRQPNNRTLFRALKAVFEIKNGSIQALDISNNQLTDRDVVLLCQYLVHHARLRILKLSHNFVTVDGLSTLVMTLRKTASVKYLLLDHNWIAFDPIYCGLLLEREKDLGVLNLDLSYNYIMRGALIEGKILADDDTLLREFGDEVDCCKRSIMKSLILHSSDQGNQSSFIHRLRSEQQYEQPFDKISTAKGCVAIMAYLDPYLNVFGTHTFLVIERILPSFGQRQLIVADLVIDDQAEVMIRVNQTDPTKFFEHVKDFESIGERVAFTDANKIEALLGFIYQCRDIRDFTKYGVFSGDGKINCHRQAVSWLIDADIISPGHAEEWLHIEKNLGQWTVFNLLNKIQECNLL